MNAPQSSIERMARPLLEFAFRFRVPLTWIVAIGAFILARPTPASILLGSGWAAIGLGWRAWAAGTIRKNTQMSSTGPYALSRHPLYFGNFMLAIGFGAASGRVLVLAAILALAFAVYFPLIREEEAAMVQIFGDRYREYIRDVPCLVPALRRIGAAGSRPGFSWRQYLANHEYKAALGFCAAVAALLVLHLAHSH